MVSEDKLICMPYKTLLILQSFLFSVILQPSQSSLSFHDPFDPLQSSSTFTIFFVLYDPFYSCDPLWPFTIFSFLHEISKSLTSTFSSLI
jgi:hypothetical protein